MGSEDLFHRRRAKSARKLERQKAKREPYERVLIVCEGSKTEPHYLQEIIDDLKLSSANVEVDPKCGSSPISVVEYAKDRYSNSVRQHDAFDRVFCVFDKDTHTTFSAALDAARNARPKGKFRAIYSVPCFEYWLLLHFIFTTSPFAAAGGKSVCCCLIQKLKNHIPGYSKGDRDVFQKLMAHTDTAIARSKNALQQAQMNSTDNPTTLMHELVEYLREIKA